MGQHLCPRFRHQELAEHVSQFGLAGNSNNNAFVCLFGGLDAGFSFLVGSITVVACGSCISLELSRGKTLLTKDFLLISDIRWIGKSRMCQNGSGNEVGFCAGKT